MPTVYANREIFPNALIFPMYGLTECMRGCYLEPELVTAKPASVGRGIPGSETLILDREGSPVAPGTTLKYAVLLAVGEPHARQIP